MIILSSPLVWILFDMFHPLPNPSRFIAFSFHRLPVSTWLFRLSKDGFVLILKERFRIRTHQTLPSRILLFGNGLCEKEIFVS